MTRLFFSLSLVCLMLVPINLDAQESPNIDEVAVKRTLKRFFKGTNKHSWKDFLGIQDTGNNSSTAYFVISTNKKKRISLAKMVFLMKRGWYISRIEVGQDGPMGTPEYYWGNLFIRVERKK